MKANTLKFLSCATVLASAALPSHAADGDADVNKNRFGLSYRMGFNISAEFKNVGAAPFANNPSVNGVSYQDGFVGTDSTGNAGGLTTHWGYQNAGQAQTPYTYLVLRSAGTGTLFKDVDADPIHGFEFTCARELGGGQKVRWGLEAAFNWASPDFSAGGPAPTSVMFADRFGLGYAPPAPGYVGPVTAGPGVPLLGTAPTREAILVNSKLETSLYGFRLGPYLDVPLGPQVKLTFDGGLAFAYVESTLSYQERYAATTMAASGSGSDLIVGGYVGAQLSLALSDHVGLFTGVTYQPLDSYTQRVGDKEAKLDFSGALFWNCGLSIGF